MVTRRGALVLLAVVVAGCGANATTTTGPSDAGTGADGGRDFAISRCPMPTADGEPLTCEWLQSTKNCWVDAIQVVASCPVGAGTIAADGLSCADPRQAYAASFNLPALHDPVARDRLVEYAVIPSTGGVTCYSASFFTPPAPPASTPADLTITTPAGCASLVASTQTLTITCPDGMSHSALFSALGACRFPGYVLNAGTNGVSLGLSWGENAVGKSATAGVVALSCSF
jgi:hypothetical protein